ncbi:MAG: outer membrane protein [Desulfovibrionaceae bacterium]
MKKYYYSLILIFGIFLLPGSSYAIDSYLAVKGIGGYAPLSLKDSSGNSKTDTPIRWGGGLALGLKVDLFIVKLRAEAEYLYKTSAKSFKEPLPSKFTFSNHNIMANAYLDLSFVPFITPYVSAGVGYSFNDGKFTPNDAGLALSGASSKATNFIYQFGLGIFAGFDFVGIDLNLRYLNNGETISGTYAAFSGKQFTFSANPHSLEALLAIRFTF